MYSTTCECGAKYIGETHGRPFATRVSKHKKKRVWIGDIRSSTLAQHAGEEQNYFQ